VSPRGGRGPEAARLRHPSGARRENYGLTLSTDEVVVLVGMAALLEPALARDPVGERVIRKCRAAVAAVGGNPHARLHLRVTP
jgi:hypothetical protein